MSEVLKPGADDMSGKVDTKPFEEKLAAAVDPALIKKMAEEGNYVMSVMVAEREVLRMKGKDATIFEMMGSAAEKTHFRHMVEAYVDMAHASNITEVPLLVGVPADSSSLVMLDAALNAGAAIIAKERGEMDKMVKFKSTGIVPPELQFAGLDWSIIDQARERIAQHEAESKEK